MDSGAAPYGARFYDTQAAGSLRSAKIVLGLLYGLYQPRTVVDFGCGRGAWLAAAGALGAKTLTGYDGAWAREQTLLDERIDFRPVNMEEDIAPGGRCDLALSVEVAEHLAARRAQPFVETLCRASDVVLFGAAIRHQGGTHHVNEQYQPYWIELFAHNGYECFDIFRPHLWCNDDVDWWYRQNTFLFVNRKAAGVLLDRERLRALERPIADVVHPRNYEAQLRHYRAPTLRVCLQVARDFALRKLGLRRDRTG